ncbi:hypothetical protein FACS1894216_14820 [Synergistales bacterium]|nr:hypothetical protein FACS1894216_14820 [Synergistales bacterium]
MNKMTKLKFALSSFVNRLAAEPVICVLLCAYLLLLVMTAWTGDDAFIAYGTAKQFLHGNGLRYNMDERVQSFTSPLGLFAIILVSALTGEGYFAMLIVNFITSIAAVIIFAFYMCERRDAGKPLSHTAILPLVILITSKSFVEWSTSGLETSIM